MNDLVRESVWVSERVRCWYLWRCYCWLLVLVMVVAIGKIIVCNQHIFACGFGNWHFRHFCLLVSNDESFRILLGSGCPIGSEGKILCRWVHERINVKDRWYQNNCVLIPFSHATCPPHRALAWLFRQRRSLALPVCAQVVHECRNQAPMTSGKKANWSRMIHMHLMPLQRARYLPN